MTRRVPFLVLLCVCLSTGSTAFAQRRGLLDRLKEEAREEIEGALRNSEAPDRATSNGDEPQPAAAAPAAIPVPAPPAAASAPAAVQAPGASSWRSTGAWGAIEASTSGSSVVLTFDGGRAVVTQASDGSYVGEWLGGRGTAVCPSPRDGAASWGAVKIITPSPNMLLASLTPCAAVGAAGSSAPTSTFPANLTAGTSPFTALGEFQAAARAQAARTEAPAARTVPSQAAAVESSGSERLAAANASVRGANAQTDFGNIASMAARCEQTKIASGHTDGNALNCSNACRMAAEQQSTAEPIQVRLLVQTCETSYARAYGLPAPDYSTPEQRAATNERVARTEAAAAAERARNEQTAARARQAAASAPAAPVAQVPERFRQYKAPWYMYQVYDLKPEVWKPKDYRLDVIFNAYVRAFDSLCQAYLPADSVLYEPTYMAYDHTEFGLAFNTHVYKETVAESTRMKRDYLPIYVESKNWWAKVIAQDELDDLKTIADLMPLLIPGQFLFNEAVAAKDDTERLLKVEGCDSAFTRQFEQNAVRAIVDPPKHAPGTVIASAAVAGTELRFANEERYFVPAIPDPLPALPLTMTIDPPPPGDHLVRMQLLNASVNPFDPRMTATDFPPSVQTAIAEDFARAREQGQLVLTCRWATPNGLTRTQAFWYKSLVAVVADAAALTARAPDHPMLRVREARSTCEPRNPVD